MLVNGVTVYCGTITNGEGIVFQTLSQSLEEVKSCISDEYNIRAKVFGGKKSSPDWFGLSNTVFSTGYYIETKCEVSILPYLV